MSGRGRHAPGPPWRVFLAAAAASVLGVAGGLAVYWRLIADRPPDFFFDRNCDAAIAAAARRHRLPEALVRGLIRKESRFRPNAVGKHGEIGLMQVLPSGAVREWARIHKRPEPSRREVFQVELNLEIGCWYLAYTHRRWKKYRHCTELALAHYNAGGRNAARWAPPDPAGEVIPRIDWPGTRRYVTDIMKYCAEEKRRRKNLLQ